mgnify:CR=1 FL=1
MIEQHRFSEVQTDEIKAAMRATIAYTNLIFEDRSLRENLPASSQLITVRECNKNAMFKARSEARSHVRSGTAAVVFDPFTMTAYVYEPNQPLRILRGNPNPLFER